MDKVEAILNFWFGPLEGEFDFPVEKAKIWFQGGEAVDEAIRRQFSETVQLAQTNNLDDWRKTPHGTLALIILLDQFTRNLNKNKEAFASDAKALGLAQAAVENGTELKLRRIERAFLYLPFEHSEDLAMQRKCVELFEKLCEGVPANVELPFLNMLDYAKQHYKIIERFGRFPHRNEKLGRESTKEEISFLSEPNSSF